jgi:hypothetical protein
MSTNRVIDGTSRAPRQWSVTYTQADIDFIREQIEQTESYKRRGLLLAFLVTLAVLVGALFLLGNVYSNYRSSESNQAKLTQESAALQTNASQTQKQLDAARAALEKEARERAEAQARLEKLLPVVASGGAGPSDIATFARLVNRLPGATVELPGKPPDGLFRNWKLTEGNATEMYSLIGGFVNGKWTVSSALISRRNAGSGP